MNDPLLPPLQTLVSLGLTFSARMSTEKDRPEVRDEEPEYGLSPDLGRLATFAGYDPWSSPEVRGPELHPLLQQMLATEVRLARMAASYRERAVTVRAGGNGEAVGRTAPVAVALPEHVKRQLADGGKGAAARLAAAAAVEVALPPPDVPRKPATQLQYLSDRSVRSREQDLARKRSAIEATRVQANGVKAPPVVGAAPYAGAKAAPVTFLFTYKYHEGFTNAVRRPVTLRDFQ